QFFLQQLLGSTAPTLASCVVPAAGAAHQIEENEGTDPIFTAGTGLPTGQSVDNIIVPYSIGVYLSQTDRGTGHASPGNLVIRSVEGQSPTVDQDGVPVFNQDSFPIPRLLFNVVKADSAATVQAPIPDSLVGIFGTDGFICANPDTISEFGFLPLPG